MWNKEDYNACFSYWHEVSISIFFCSRIPLRVRLLSLVLENTISKEILKCVLPTSKCHFNINYKIKISHVKNPRFNFCTVLFAKGFFSRDFAKVLNFNKIFRIGCDIYHLTYLSLKQKVKKFWRHLLSSFLRMGNVPPW